MLCEDRSVGVGAEKEEGERKDNGRGADSRDGGDTTMTATVEKGTDTGRVIGVSPSLAPSTDSVLGEGLKHDNTPI